VYGYTASELYNEQSPAVSNYPYGISKLQGEQAVLQMVDDSFSVICFRQGTVSGYSPRMRLDLIVNTMFKSAMAMKKIVINNPSIWRPVLSIEDSASAYVRGIEASQDISGLFNIASANYTVGEVGDIVKQVVEAEFGVDIQLEIRNEHDMRNYKVDVSKAVNMIGFKPKHDVESILANLIRNLPSFQDFENDNYYNIRMFRKLALKKGI
jgi:nucleoside-diphosphate-sugar epimerase